MVREMAVEHPRATAARFQKQREQTRAELLSSARRVLARRGFHRTKVADIAHEAGVAVGTFYLYYPTKEALFLELVEETVGLLKTEIDASHRAAADPRDQARADLEIFFRFAQEHRELFRIVFGHGATFHDVVQRTQQVFAEDVRANLAEGMDTQVFRRNDPTILAQAFIGMSLQVVSWWLDHPEVALSDVVASLLDFVSHGAEAPQPQAG
jgi:AcrR family transcriptional regulator